MKDYAKPLLAFAIIGLFAYAIMHNPNDEQLKTALNNSIFIVLGFYFGSSHYANKSVSAMTQSLLSQPQEVVVTNDADKPVPTVEGR